MSVTPSHSSAPVAKPIFRPSKRGPWLQIRYPWNFEFNRIELPIVGMPAELSGLRILHLTDLHFRAGWARPFDELIERVTADPPDLILFTGDLVEHHYDPRPAFDSAGQLASALPSKLGKFAILGNHDGDLLGPMWRGWGVTLINGAVATVPWHDETIELIGLPGVHREDLTDEILASLTPADVAAEMRSVEMSSVEMNSVETQPTDASAPPTLVRRAGLRIILSHYPDALRQVAHFRPDLVLAGHTHGGQLCLPGGIPILTHDALPRYTSRGLHRLYDTWLLVGRGFGFSTWPLRTFCPAEVIEVTLVTA